MKKIILSLIYSSILLSGCSKFLEERQTTAYSTEDMYNSEAGLESAILGCYKQLASCGFKNSYFMEFLAPGSGLCHWGGRSSDRLTNALERWTCNLKFTRYSTHPESYTSMQRLYKAIYRCNALLENLKSSPVDDDYKREIEGETYFIRAAAYFWLVRLYGDVPLITTVPKNVDELYKYRENFWTVYEQVISDLNQAEDKARSFERMCGISGNGAGRVCNYAATAMRSLVYLTIGTLLAHPDDNFWLNEVRKPDFSGIGVNSARDAFTKALTDAKDVIENGPFELAPSYAQLFRWTEPEDWQLKERIFVMPTSPEGSGGDLALYSLPQGYQCGIANNLYGRIRPTRWLFQKWCETYGGVKGSGDNQKEIYVDCPDPRLGISLIYNSYLGNSTSATKKSNLYPHDTYVYLENKSTNWQRGFPYFKKYYDPTYAATTGYADLYVMRFAEVLLIAAEACANLSSSASDDYGSQAIEYVNRLLARARNSTSDGTPSSEPADWQVSDFKSKDELINAIFWERAFELIGEQHEWFDTHRMGAKWLTDNIAKPKNTFLKKDEQLALRDYNYGTGFEYDEDWTAVRKGLISAFPKDELVLNTALDVNKHDPNYGQNPLEVFWK